MVISFHFSLVNIYTSITQYVQYMLYMQCITVLNIYIRIKLPNTINSTVDGDCLIEQNWRNHLPAQDLLRS